MGHNPHISRTIISRASHHGRDIHKSYNLPRVRVLRRQLPAQQLGWKVGRPQEPCRAGVTTCPDERAYVAITRRDVRVMSIPADVLMWTNGRTPQCSRPLVDRIQASMRENVAKRARRKDTNGNIEWNKWWLPTHNCLSLLNGEYTLLRDRLRRWYDRTNKNLRTTRLMKC